MGIKLQQFILSILSDKNAWSLKGKTGANGKPLEGQKRTDDERLTNGQRTLLEEFDRFA